MIHCNQPTGDSFIAIKGESALIQNQMILVPLENLIVSQNRVRGQCKTLVQVGPGSKDVPGIGSAIFIVFYD
jgi:hypothetical protein